MKFLLLIFVSTLLFSNTNGQVTIKCEFGFAGKKKGELSLSELLSDSVTFECTEGANEYLRVGRFSLITKCEGVTRIFTNENDGLLNNVMKAEVRNMKPGCLVEFSNIFLDALPDRKFGGYSYPAENPKFRIK